MVYLNDRLCNGECRLNMIAIDAVRQLLEERLREPRRCSKSEGSTSRVHFASIGIEGIDPIYQAIHRDECKNLARKVTWCFYIFGLRIQANSQQ